MDRYTGEQTDNPTNRLNDLFVYVDPSLLLIVLPCVVHSDANDDGIHH